MDNRKGGNQFLHNCGLALACAILLFFCWSLVTDEARASGVSRASTYNAASVAITGGTINGVTIGGAASGVVNASTLNASTLNATAGTLNGVTLTTINSVLAQTQLTNSLSGDVALANVGTYYDGPSVAQGSTGTWCAMGTVTVQNTAANGDVYKAKLWDGTTVIASATSTQSSGATGIAISLSGCKDSPAGNLRISVNDATNTANVAIRFNVSGNSKDSTITAWRIK